MNRIPYRNLLIMQKDKLHSVKRGDVKIEASSEAEMGIVFDDEEDEE